MCFIIVTSYLTVTKLLFPNTVNDILKVTVILLSALARDVSLALSEAILTLVNDGATLSSVLKFNVVKVYYSRFYYSFLSGSFVVVT